MSMFLGFFSILILILILILVSSVFAFSMYMVPPFSFHWRSSLSAHGRDS